MNKPTLTKKQQKTIGIAAIAAALVLTAVIAWFVGIPLVRFASQPERFRAWVESHGVWGYAAYAGMVIFQVFLAILPGEPFEIAAGYTFGALEGTLVCLLASTVGSMGVFLLVRRFGVHLVEIFFPVEKLRSLRFLKRGTKRDLLFLLIFMIPGTPKDLLCYFAGLTDIRIGTWLLICSVGRLPSIVTSTIGGDALGEKQYWFAAAVFAATLLLSGAGLLLYRRICAHHGRRDTESV